MGSSEVITLDDTANSSAMFVIDETPILDEITTIGRKRKLPHQGKGQKKRNSSYLVLGGQVNDNPWPNGTKRNMKRKKKKSLETIVIDDDDSVIELSDDDDVGVIGGEVSVSMERVQHQLGNYQIRGFKNKQRRNINSSKKFEISEKPKKKNDQTSNNIPEKTKDLSPTLVRKLRPVVIDGSNVAYGHSNQACFSSRGIEICCNYFLSRGHKVKVFIPQFRRRHPATKDHHILDKLEQEKILIFTPSRSIGRKTIASYDDRMMVEYAAQCGGVVVTRDNLRDIAAESDTFKEVVEQRILMFTWVDEDVIMFPNDPLGRGGPVLADFLSFPPEESGEKSSISNETSDSSKSAEEIVSATKQK